MNPAERDQPIRRYAVVAMLFAFMAINFADKSILGLAALPIMAELHLTHLQFGWVAGSFFALFSVSALGVSALGDVAPKRWLLLAMAVLWTVAQAPMAWKVGFATFLGSRVLLGASEGPAYPVALHEAYTWFADRRRPAITAIIQTGVPVGTAGAALVLTGVISAFGWHAAYALLAVASFVWCALWVVVPRPNPSAAMRAERLANAAARRVPIKSLLLNRTLLGAMLAIFAGYWLMTLALTWLPAFLQTAAGLSAWNAGTLLTVAWLIQLPLYPAVGWLCGALTSRGYPPELTRGGLGAFGVALSGLASVGIALFHSKLLLIGLVPVVTASVVVVGVTAFPMIAEVVPGGQIGVTLGATTAVYALAGVIAPVVVGRVLDTAPSVTVGYTWAFAGSGLLVVIAALCSFLLMKPSADREELAAIADPVPSLATK